MKQAVLLLAHGAPERVEDVASYLSFVRGGRPMAPRVVAEVERRYAEIGGGSPLLARTRRQAEALQAKLGLPVYVGMRNWQPFIKDTADRMVVEGVERAVSICLAPQYSDLSVGLYIRRAEEAVAGRFALAWTRSFHDHPLLIESFAERLAPLVNRRRVIFSAHSLPERILAAGDPYDREARATAAAVAARLNLQDWDFAYQSQGMTEEKWLGPTVEERLEMCSGEVVVHPIGFVSDHVEILYDVDVLFRNFAAERGIRLLRPESLNDSPTFIAALADIAARCLA